MPYMKMNWILSEDIKRIASASYIEWDKIGNSDFLITGATGLIGSAIVRVLTYVRDLRINNKIYVVVRDPAKVSLIFGDDYADKGIIPLISDVREFDIPNINVDYVIHGASVTTSRYMVTNPVETLMTSIDGTDRLLRYAAEKKVKGMVYLSSMEMYGYTMSEQNPITEEKQGYIDLRNVRSCYPEGKRACECLCNCYAKEYSVPVKIARLAQTFGAGVTSEDTRVFSSFAKSAIRHENIVLHTKGESVGNYCYTADVVGAVLCLLTKGEWGEAYNVVNEKNTMKIREMAVLVADKISGGASEVVFDNLEDSGKFGYAPDTNLRLSSEKIRALGWYSEIELAEMYKRMIDNWKMQTGE